MGKSKFSECSCFEDWLDLKYNATTEQLEKLSEIRQEELREEYRTEKDLMELFQ